ncbi:class I SAM-dependent methyltransferase [Variovorax sp. NFACC29]|uniref:class I SAM-dependent methyltransferase n=1 Tax=Variovorax sp. NFACC29 TaxID=1566272 RepID=UPI003AAD9B7F
MEEYCYTDLSKAFLLHAEKQYRAKAPYLKTQIFDVERSLAEQGVEVGRYDVVIATNVLHATREMRRTVGNTKALLKANGVVLINEMSSNSLFLQLTFGLLEGWWLSEDVPCGFRARRCWHRRPGGGCSRRRGSWTCAIRRRWRTGWASRSWWA